MKGDGRIDAGEASGSELPRRLSGAGLAESADGCARRIVHTIGGGVDNFAEACVGGTDGGCVSSAAGCDGSGGH